MRQICALGLSVFLLSLVAPVQAKPSTVAPSIAGYWVGEKPASTGADKPGGEEAAYYDPADRSALTPAVWRALQENRVPLYLHLRYGRDFGVTRPGVHSDAVELVRKANTLGIPVISWVVVPYEQGYWAYQGNAPANAEAVKAWVAWKRANQLRFVSVVLDQEFSWQNLRTYVPLAMSSDPQKLDAWMAGNIDPEAQCRALNVYRDLISWAHRQGVRADAAVAPMVIDDVEDGDMALQNALQISATSRYDRMYLMAYRSAVSQAGFDPGPAYIAANYASMQKHFGRGGQISLGIPGQAPYGDLQPLVQDVRLLAGLGAKAVPIFSLEEMVHAFGADGVRAVADAARHPMNRDELAQFSKPTAGFERMMAAGKAKNARATELTIARGRQIPNRWPDGCGDPAVTPLARK